MERGETASPTNKYRYNIDRYKIDKYRYKIDEYRYKVDIKMTDTN